jgi:hypothetical protein
MARPVASCSSAWSTGSKVSRRRAFRLDPETMPALIERLDAVRERVLDVGESLLDGSMH